MSAIVLRMPSGALSGDLVVRDVDAIRDGRGLWQEGDWDRLDEPQPQPERSPERGFHAGRPVDDEWGRSESIDPDNVGDIADEGLGHRG